MRKKLSRVFTGREIYEWGLLAEENWRAEGVPEVDIQMTRLNGMDGRDIGTVRNFTARHGLLIVIRCPKPGARAFHRLLPAKPGHLHTLALEKGPSKPPKSGRDGIVRVTQQFTREDGTPARREEYVSDYDMMSMYRWLATGLEKIWVSPDPVERPPPENPRKQYKGAFSKLATGLIRELNFNMVSHLQHGCQDDWISTNNPGVGVSSDHFTAFNAGEPTYLPRPKDCGVYYRQHNLTWSYDEGTGKFTMPKGA
jgi:hypothetical protein